MSPQRESSAAAQPTPPQAIPAGTDAPLTRRQIRERERAAERAASAATPVAGVPAAGAPDSAEPVEQPRESVAVQAEATTAVEHQGETAAVEAEATTAVEQPRESATVHAEATTAVEHQGETTGHAAMDAGAPATRGKRPGGRAPRSPRTRRWVPRLALLGTLGLATTVVPITGAALPQPSQEAPVEVVLGATSALDVLGQGGGLVPADAAQALAADPLAQARAVASASRTGSRDSMVCGTSVYEANGVLAAETTATSMELVMPIAEGSYSVSSRYGYRSIFGYYSQHTGLDFAAASGTPIHAIAEGEVIYAGGGKEGRSGMLVIIEHEINGEAVYSWYVHMYPNGVYVDAGDKVAAGEVIGAVGSYGNSTGPHLHLEIHLDRDLTTVDPASWLAEHDATRLTAETMVCAAG